MEGERRSRRRTEDTDSRKRLFLETRGEEQLRRNSGVQTACAASQLWAEHFFELQFSDVTLRVHSTRMICRASRLVH